MLLQLLTSCGYLLPATDLNSLLYSAVRRCIPILLIFVFSFKLPPLYSRVTDHEAQKTQLPYCWPRISRVAQQLSPRGPQKTLLLYYWPRLCCVGCLVVGRYVTI
jgi:hypothetical protein